MRGTTEEIVQACPECGTEVRTDPRFTAWCAACDWNVDAGGEQQERGRVERVRRALARRYGERLLDQVRNGGALRARRDASAVLAHMIALAVHAVTLALAVVGVWGVVRGWGGPGMVGGLVLLATAVALRPRYARLPEDLPVLRRADAPELHALVDDVAGSVGTRTVDAIVVDTEVNAGVSTYGMRGRRQLTIGLPLWEVLTPQQRIALLGHELGHYGNGDTRHHTIVGTALGSLARWRYYFAPIPHPVGIQLVVNLLYVPPRLVVHGVLMLLDQLTLQAAQRAEYLADREAARAGSTDAAMELMDRLLVADSAATALRREANHAARGGRSGARLAESRADVLWERLSAHMDSVPEHEYERLRRAGALRGHSVDSTHPPTHLRRACLLTGPAVPAAVVSDGARERRVAAELADARRTLAQQIIRDGYGG
ncbi:M48 family metalloprotease [Streptomyces actuosus]|uniref:M48 family metalloprotease n=1 Tax=Streptomyces actuosus TaxID=1885 RepID=A0ABS2VKD0_STRAS|nr:M48 family metallopeptidase [Streptomyces actuosus]MBN0043552.1 M48 family metalloprotease [Streptomyces actuosus]